MNDDDIPEDERCHDGDDEPHRHCSCFTENVAQCCFCGEDPE